MYTKFPEFTPKTSPVEFLLFIMTYFSTDSIFNVCQNGELSAFRVRYRVIQEESSKLSR
jgi:hypothetical protein